MSIHWTFFSLILLQDLNNSFSLGFFIHIFNFSDAQNFGEEVFFMEEESVNKKPYNNFNY